MYIIALINLQHVILLAMPLSINIAEVTESTWESEVNLRHTCYPVQDNLHSAHICLQDIYAGIYEDAQ